jgi:alpha-amylase
MQSLFDQTPTTFRNTELIYDNEIAKQAEKLGFKTILSEGVDRILKNRNPNVAYQAPETNDLKILLRNSTFSDDISFRFNDKNWQEYPLTPKKFIAKLKKYEAQADSINIFLDYETFGEHQNEDTGIFNFLKNLIVECIDVQKYTFKSPKIISNELTANQVYYVEDYISWADTERDLSAWLSNSMQFEALHKIYDMRTEVLRTENDDLIEIWRRLQTSDHYYYMCTKYWADGDVHKYFSPYNSPYDAYIYFMNIISDFELVLKNYFKHK